MAFRFEPHGSPNWVFWDDGKLTGDDDSLHALAVTPNDGTVTLPPSGPTLTYDESDAAAMLIRFIQVLGNGEAFGDVPELDNEVPEGALS